MLRSMTGFGRAVCDAPFGRLTVEIQSVNRKYLEVFVSLPKEFARFEQEMRGQIGASLSRGQISLRIFLTPNETAVATLLPDLQLLKSLKKEWEKIASSLKEDPKKIDLSFILQNMPALSKQAIAQDADLKFFQACAQDALENLMKMKKAEGKALSEDLSSRLGELKNMSGEIEKISPDATIKMKERLLRKIKEAIEGNLEERLAREVAIFAERVDITEEMIRFRSHLEQFKKLFKEEIAGRKMDFLIQEMVREVNTIASKSMEAKISHLVVNMKSELEKMREQVQNIE